MPSPRSDDAPGWLPTRFTGLGRIQVSWMVLAGMALVLALLVAAWLQVRQVTQLRAVAAMPQEASALAALRVESAYLRLREQVPLPVNAMQANDRGAVIAPSALPSAYRDWRQAVQSQAMVPPRVASDAGLVDDELHEKTNRFLQRADPLLLQANADFVVDGDGWRSLQALLQALDGPTRARAQLARAQLAALTEERGQVVHEQSRLGLALTAFLCLATLGFAAVGLQQTQRMRQLRKRLESAAAQQQVEREAAREAARARGARMALLRGSLRVPADELAAHIATLRQAALGARQIDLLQALEAAAGRVLAGVHDTLDLLQLEGASLPLHRHPTDPRALAWDVEAQLLPQAAARALTLHVDTDPGVPRQVLVDGARLRQLLLRLMAHAIDRCDQGAVSLDLRWRADVLEFTLRDSGDGQAHADWAGMLGGQPLASGLLSTSHVGAASTDLELAHKLLRLMDGEISARSQPGQGSTFVFSVPAQAVAEDDAEPASEGRPPVGPKALRVLVAEDHGINRQYLAALLAQQGHHAHFSVDGEQAVLAAQRQTFDLVLMDLHMPLLDGVAATRAIRAGPDPAKATVPIVALTADAHAETRERCLGAGMNDFLTKPVSPDGLAACLRRLFGSGATLPGPPVAGAPAALTPVMPEPALAGPHAPAPLVLVDPAVMARSLQAMSAAQLRAMATAYLDEGPQTLQRLHGAVRDAQPPELRLHAHAAQGAALNLGLAALANVAQALQAGAAHLPAHEIARLVLRYEALLPATRQALDDGLRQAQALAQQGRA